MTIKTTAEALAELAALGTAVTQADLQRLASEVSIDAGKGEAGKTTVLYSGSLLETPNTPSANVVIEKAMGRGTLANLGRREAI